ncbi:MAG: hypothetical protein AAF432_05440 [Planctomycetota bacterium]
MALEDILDDLDQEITDAEKDLRGKSVPLATSGPVYNTVSTNLTDAKQNSIDAQNEPALSGFTGAPILVPNPPGTGDIPWVDQLVAWSAEAKDLFTNKGPGNFKQEIANRMKSIEEHEADARAEALQ